MSYPWFRFYPEAAHDEKIICIARELEMSKLTITGAWALILCVASDSPVRGKLLVTLQKRYSNAALSDLFKESPEVTEKIMRAFVDLEMLVIEKGTYIVVNWAKRQPNSDNSAERVKRFREKQEDVKRYKTVTKTLPSVSTSTSDSVFIKYEHEIGTITQKISEELKDAEKEYPEADWIESAIDEAVRNNKRSWAYVHAILKRWKVEGFQSNNKKNGKSAQVEDESWKKEYSTSE
jgi:DnaD/phage-associated family protein